MEYDDMKEAIKNLKIQQDFNLFIKQCYHIV